MADMGRISADMDERSRRDRIGFEAAVGLERLSSREKVRRGLNSLHWQAVIMIAVVVDLSMIVVDVAGGPLIPVQVVTGLVLLVFTLDLALRFYALRCRLFFKRWESWFDLVIVVASAALLGVEIVQEMKTGVASSAAALARASRAAKSIIISLRVARVVRGIRMATRVGRGTQAAARQLTGENKKRFIDLENDFDLDLVYLRPELIVMSVPATGRTALYRNPLGEVVRFFETRHGRSGYRIVNCCPEKDYPAQRFGSGEVVRFDIQDHTPPTMAQFVEFLNTAAPYVLQQPGRVLAVHCRGGKGRSGSMCCAWLLFTRACEDAADVLQMFALERTELRLGWAKLQGVDTPSQRRYVMQLDVLLRAQQTYCNLEAPLGAPPPPLIAPPPRPLLTIRALELRRWFAAMPPGALVAAVHLESAIRPGGAVVAWSKVVHPPDVRATVRGPVFLSGVLGHSAATGEPTAEEPPVRFEFGEGVEAAGDVRVSVFHLPKLTKAREKRLKKGLDARFDFDEALLGPFHDGHEEGGGGGGGGGGATPGQQQPAQPAAAQADLEAQDGGGFEPTMVGGVEGGGGTRAVGGERTAPEQRAIPRDGSIEPSMAANQRAQPSLHQAGRQQTWRKRAAVVAGKEPGCAFYFLVHSAFVDCAKGAYDVPVHMMDKAFKDRRGRKYRADGVATLRFDTFSGDRSLLPADERGGLVPLTESISDMPEI